jgi:hypothetical protein
MVLHINRWVTYLILALGLMISPAAFSQVDTEEAYDPFSDYSEFDEASDEEADVNFFRNGRFLTVGIAVGPQTFTDGMGKVYKDAPSMGLTLSYFFDLRLAMTLGLITTDHSVNIKTTGQTFTGNVGFSEVNMNLKYYLSTQNMVKGLADMNPYLVGGLSQVTRTYSIAELAEDSRDTAISTDIGAGLEIPLMRRKSFLGFQMVYHYISFNDESKGFINAQPLQTKINGDFINWQLILGMNF